MAKASNNRLGYVHMPDMSAGSLAQLYVDLDADNIARDGVVIDIRNNNGGFVNAYALDVFARQHYLNMTQRGAPTAPARSALGQRSLEKPTVLVTNQHSLSDAEDFTEGYRAMKLGKVVGEPTAGWIIFTWNTRLMDGTVLRLPRSRITDRHGAPMEMHPRPVDVEVKRPIGESYGPRDSQLDKAIEVLLTADRIDCDNPARLRESLSRRRPGDRSDVVGDPCGSRCCRFRARRLVASSGAPVLVGVVEAGDRPLLDRALRLVAFLALRLALVLGRSVGPEVLGAARAVAAAAESARPRPLNPPGRGA